MNWRHISTRVPYGDHQLYEQECEKKFQRVPEETLVSIYAGFY